MSDEVSSHHTLRLCFSILQYKDCLQNREKRTMNCSVLGQKETRWRSSAQRWPLTRVTWHPSLQNQLEVLKDVWACLSH